MYTTEQAIALAQEVEVDGWKYALVFHADELTALCNMVRRNTLLEAAEVATCGGFGSRIIEEVIADELRRMAGE